MRQAVFHFPLSLILPLCATVLACALAIPLTAGVAQARECAAIIYEHANYKGNAQCLQEGRYNLRNLKIGNDRLSSVKVRKGNRVILFEHENFGGRKGVLKKSSSYVGDKWNDITSSIIVE
ncbi:MAG: hypothetical protein LBR31_00570 [Desulfovibrio sp.]|nr:hypothetical protein [Desulfovibrio sp.]